MTRCCVHPSRPVPAIIPTIRAFFLGVERGCLYQRKPTPLCWSYIGKRGISAIDAPSKVCVPGCRKPCSPWSFSFNHGIEKKSASWIVQSEGADATVASCSDTDEEKDRTIECRRRWTTSSRGVVAEDGSSPNNWDEACFCCDRMRNSLCFTCEVVVLSRDCTVREYCRACGSTLPK